MRHSGFVTFVCLAAIALVVGYIAGSLIAEAMLP
jgi:hypothetical protein